LAVDTCDKIFRRSLFSRGIRSIALFFATILFGPLGRDERSGCNRRNFL
jgi:hypothetical protein